MSDTAPLSRVEVISRGRGLPVTEYDLDFDGETVGGLEWVGGWHPEMHLEAPGGSAFVALRRLRPFVVVGIWEGRPHDERHIVHVGSAGRGILEVDGVQFMRETRVSGRQEVRNGDGTVLLRSLGASGRRLLVYDAKDSDLTIPQLLQVVLVEAFCAAFPGRHFFRALATAWAPVPKMGTPLASVPVVERLSPPENRRDQEGV